MKRFLVVLGLLLALVAAPRHSDALSPGARMVLFSSACQKIGGVCPSAGMNFVGGNICQIGGQTVPCSSVLSVTRASSHLCQYANGTWISVGNNIACITDQGFLIEEARTNVLTNSQVFNSWPIKTDLTILDNNILAPDNTTTGALVTEGSAGTATLTSNAGTITGSTASVGAIFLKKSATQWIRIVYADSTGTDGFNLWVDLTNGALGSNSNRGTGTFGSASISTNAYGWYRIAFTGTLTTRTNATISVVSASANGSTTRVNGATYYVWQGDINSAASFITSPIITAGASATRAADIPQLIGAAASAALAAKAAFAQTFGNEGITSLARIATINNGYFYYGTTTSVSATPDGVASATATIGAAGTISGTVKASFGFDGAGVTAKANGGTMATNATAWSNSSGSVYLGNFSGGTRALNGYMQRFALSPVKGVFDGATSP